MNLIKLIIYVLSISPLASAPVANAALAINATVNQIKNFQSYIAQYGKTYLSPADFGARLTTYLDNVKKIQDHNSNAGAGFKMVVNRFTDLSSEERSQFLGLAKADKPVPKSDNVTPEASGLTSENTFAGLPRKVDWRERKIISPVKDQKSCGSCTMFATAGLVESWYLRSNGRAHNLSEQELVDCTKRDGNYGCEGGLNENNLKYMNRRGISREKSYPYTATTNSCRSTFFRKVSVGGYGIVPTFNWRSYIEQLSKGPVTTDFAVVDALYSINGIDPFPVSDCANDVQPNHAVLAIGYDLDATPNPYILLKNSWGTEWGDSGFFKLAFDPANVNSACNAISINDNIFMK